MQERTKWKLAAAVAALSVAGTTYQSGFRPWMQHWGASDDEARMPLPGDEIVAKPRVATTRAITINSRREHVWPWLIQMGQGRAGFYSYDFLENLIGLDIHSAGTIVPEWQHLHAGDTVPLSPADKGRFGLLVAVIDPVRTLILRSPGSREDALASDFPWASWAFVLLPWEAGHTRFLVRWRADFRPTLAAFAANKWLLEPVHFLMERAMMLGIRDRAEQMVHASVAESGSGIRVGSEPSGIPG